MKKDDALNVLRLLQPFFDAEAEKNNPARVASAPGQFGNVFVYMQFKQAADGLRYATDLIERGQVTVETPAATESASGADEVTPPQ